MKISKFQFKDPVLLGVHFSVNEEFHTEKNCEVNLNTTVTVRKSEEEHNSATVTVIVEVGEKNNNSPFFISVQEQANFWWEDTGGEDSQADIDRLLDQNAPALLIGYIRPVIASITSSSPFPTFNLPFLDLTEQGNNN